MNFPCPIAIHCPDNPFANLSSEGVEVWIAVGYCCDSSLRQGFSALSQGDAFLATAQLMRETCPDCRDRPQQFCAKADCPDGSNLTEICVPSSQADADALAAAAAAAMLPFCDTKDQLFEATCTCPDGVTDPHTTRSNISQEIADAECAVIPKTCPGIPNAGASCTVKCPDGTPFTYTLPPGTITAATQAEADALAQQLACERAKELIFCLEPIAPCACVGVQYTALVRLSYGTRPVTFSIVSGALPSTFSFGQTSNGFLFGGVPVVTGNYAFEIRATDADGNFVQKQYFLNVIGITTTSLPDYTVGTPYSFQLTASGGSANYSWAIQSGALPDGLTLSTSGLISGTPTGINSGTMPMSFAVVDLVCESELKSQFPPKATLKTTSITTTRTKHGWFAYGANSGTLYKRFDVTGSHTQIALTSPLVKPPSLGLEFCGGAKQVYSGYCQLNLSGNVVHLHDKHLTFACDQGAPVVQRPFLQPDGTFFWTPEDNVSTLLGYCWQDDPESCDLCSATETDWINGGNYAQANSRDIPWNMLIDEDQITTSPTVLSYNHTAERFFDRIVREDLSYPTGFPHGSTNVYEIDEPWIRISSTGNFTITLSDPYTDAEAEATKVVAVGLGSVANGGTSQLWTTQYIKNLSVRITDVNFTIHCTNLIAGEEYTVNYELWNQTTNAKTIVAVTFTAADNEHAVTGTIPTPAFGQSIKIRNATIRLT